MADFRAAKCLLVAVAMAIAVAGSAAYAWGPVGHSEVGAIADARLKRHPRAAAQVRVILGSITLAQAGPWGDCVRSVTGPSDGFRYEPLPQFRPPCLDFETPELIAGMIDYARNNWTNCSYARNDGCHTQYHFAYLAPQRSGYRFGDAGTNDYDIVQATKAAIAVLRSDECGGPAPATARPVTPAPFNFTCRQALLILTHLVGDLHQPLHVGSIYLDESGRQVDPNSSPAERARELQTTTLNATALVWGDESNRSRLHSAWDGGITGLGYDLPCPSRNSRPACVSLERAGRVVPATGLVPTWPEQWANDSLARARSAIAGLSFGPKQGNRWPVIFADQAAYLRSMEATKREQIERGGARLAQLLVAIWPDR